MGGVTESDGLSVRLSALHLLLLLIVAKAIEDTIAIILLRADTQNAEMTAVVGVILY